MILRFLIIFLCCISSSVYADYWAFSVGAFPRASSPLELCEKHFKVKGIQIVDYKEKRSARCLTSNGGLLGDMYYIVDSKCHHAGTPSTVFFSQGSAIPQVGCEPVKGGFCKWELLGDPKNPLIVNLPNTSGGESHSSVTHTSQGFVTSCKTKDTNSCDTSDPYGGCYTPPNDGCTRHKDGSISCPPDKPPIIQQGCENNATYCEQPKDGCGDGYVSGNFNGKPLCVISNSLKPNENSSNEPKKNNTDPNNSSATNNNHDASQNGTQNSGSSGSSGSHGSSSNNGSSNTGGDNATVEHDNNQLKGDGKGCSSFSNCDWVKNSTFEDFVKGFKDLFDGEKIQKDADKELKGIGEPSNDSRITQAEGNVTSSINKLSNMLTFSNRSCINDFQINVLGYNIAIAISEYCSLMALIKIFLQLFVYILCLRLIVGEVSKL